MTRSRILIATVLLGIALGVMVALSGLLLVGSLLFGDAGVPVSGAGLFVLLTVGAGPILSLVGIAVVVAALKLLAGRVWARTVLEIIAWFGIFVAFASVAYMARHRMLIESKDVVQTAIFLLLTVGPTIVLIILLRSGATRRALRWKIE